MTDYIEYSDPEGEKWRIEAGADFISFFALTGSQQEIEEFVFKIHKALSSQPVVWDVVSRKFAITPLFGQEDPEYFQPWATPVIAEKRGMAEDEVEHHLREAAGIWRKVRRAGEIKEDERRSDQMEDLLPEARRALFKRYGIATKGIEEDQLNYMAKRVRELEEFFESPNQRAVAMSLLETECGLFFAITPAVQRLQAKMNGAEDISSEQEQRLSKLSSARNQASEMMQKFMEQLGISEEQNSTLRRGRIFRECLSLLVEGVREYESHGDNALVDGVFRLCEVEVLTKEFTARPAQYRPDLILQMPQYVEGLFNQEFEPVGIPAKPMRRLMAGFLRGLADARAENGETVGELDPESAEDARDEMIERAQVEARHASPVPQSRDTPPAPMAITDGSRRSADDEFYVAQ